MLFRSALRLFRLFGVDVFVHWSWVLAPLIIVGLRRQDMPVPTVWFALIVCLALFAIVLMHEFGHALACKSVGGRADRIVLWPLGGIAFVQPPPRPGPVLWSIAAGPLVNVLLVPVTGLIFLAAYYGSGQFDHPLTYLAGQIALVNIGLLVFNIFPIYPLDGGQILQSLLWFIVGRPLSLIIAASLGIAGGALLVLLSVIGGGWWLAIMAMFIVMQSLAGLRQGMLLHRIASQPRHVGPQCPACREAPPMGLFWRCVCGQPFDIFAARGTCPRCGQFYPTVACPLCMTQSPAAEWFAGGTSLPPEPVPAPPAMVPAEASTNRPVV